MLTHTFIHLPYIGDRTEQRLWKEGIQTWESLLRYLKSWPVSSKRRKELTGRVLQSLENSTEAYYFSNLLRPKDRWRLYPDFMNSCAFLDIETSGTSSWYNEITVIGLFDGKTFKQFINGHNIEQFENEIHKYKLLVTFNGTTFDLPFLKFFFRHLELRCGHVDLRYVMAELGYRGGLKAIEKKLGLERPRNVNGLSGWEAVWLWERYQKGDEDALNTLIEYNKQDVVNLKNLIEFACETYVRNHVSKFIAYSLPWHKPT